MRNLFPSVAGRLPTVLWYQNARRNLSCAAQYLLIKQD